MSPHEPFSECVAISDASQPIRQGDVFTWLAPEIPWRQHGVVVTADCDIEHGKHAGILSYVPVLSVKQYLATTWLPNRLETALTPIRERLLALVRTYQATNLVDSSPEPISEVALRKWFEDRTPEEISVALRLSKEQQTDFMQVATTYHSTIPALRSSSFDLLSSTLIQLRVLSGVTTDKAESAIRSQIAARVASLPGDAFYIGSLTPALRDGFTAYLRLVREVNESEIALRTSDVGPGSIRAQRVARLASPYLYRLTQQLAEVFSSIGLPEDYERSRDSLAQGLIPTRGKA